MSTSQTNGEPLGARLKRLRIAADLNKAQLARRVGVSDVSISYWESGEIEQIGHLRLLALADALEVTVSELLGDPRLARRDAEIRGKALREVAAHIYNGEMSPSELAKWCRDQDQDGRRQAEASDQAERTPNSGL